MPHRVLSDLLRVVQEVALDHGLVRVPTASHTFVEVVILLHIA